MLLKPPVGGDTLQTAMAFKLAGSVAPSGGLIDRTEGIRDPPAHAGGKQITAAVWG
jgi:hypothetical protein